MVVTIRKPGYKIESDIDDTRSRLVKRERYDEDGNRLSPPWEVDPFKALEAEQRKRMKEAKPIADLLNLYDTYLYWKSYALRGALKAEEFENQITAILKTASPEVKEAARKKRLEIIGNPDRHKAGMARDRALIESLFYVKEEPNE